MASYRVAFVSLGCAKNLVNTEQMMYLTREAGHVLTGDPDGADVAVLNTCGFIDSAKSEAIDQILELAERKKEGKLKKLLVAGCLSERYREELQAELPEVDGVLGCGSYSDVVRAIDEVMAGGSPACFGDIHAPVEELGRVLATPPYTAYLRIAEGCDNHCAYCIIPSLRGKFRSRAMDAVVAEARDLAEQGVKELIVVAQDTTRYGLDRAGRHQLPELLEQLCAIDGIRWIRLHYLYPDEVDEALIDVVARQVKILPYLDIPIQHCSDKILSRMNRRGTKAELTKLFETLKERIPKVVIRSSIICGLPGEGEEEFEELCDFLEEMQLQRVGVFPYSPEEGTAAAEMPDRVETEVAEQRAERLVELQSRIMDAFNEEFLGRTVEVLCEGFDAQAGCYAGRSYADSPDVDGKIYFTAAGIIPPGEFVTVRITGTEDGDLTGEVE